MHTPVTAVHDLGGRLEAATLKHYAMSVYTACVKTSTFTALGKEEEVKRVWHCLLTNVSPCGKPIRNSPAASMHVDLIVRGVKNDHTCPSLSLARDGV